MLGNSNKDRALRQNPLVVVTDETRAALAINQSQQFEASNIRAALVTPEMFEAWMNSETQSLVLLTCKEGCWMAVPVTTKRLETGTSKLLPKVLKEIERRGTQGKRLEAVK